MESNRLNIAIHQQKAFDDIKKQIKAKGLTKEALHLLRHLFIDQHQNAISELECLGYLESLTLKDKHIKSITKVLDTFQSLYSDVLNLYVNKRANHGTALFLSIPLEKLKMKDALKEPNLMAYTNDFNHLATIISYDVLSKKTLAHALLAADRWVQIMHLSLEEKYDFQTLKALVAGFYSLKITGDDHQLLAMEAKKLYERISVLLSRRETVMNSLVQGAIVPPVETYTSILLRAENQNLSDNASTENQEAITNAIDQLAHFQEKLEQLEIFKNALGQNQAPMSATPPLSIIEDAFNLVRKDYAGFASLPDTKCDFLLTALTFKPNSKNMLRHLLDEIKPDEWEDVIKGLCKNAVIEKDSWFKTKLSKRIKKLENIDIKKRVKIQAMINPDKLSSYLKKLPADEKNEALIEVLIYLKGRSTLLNETVNQYIEALDDKNKQNFLKQEIAKLVAVKATPPLPDFNVLVDGKNAIWELLNKRVNKAIGEEAKNLPIARDLIPSISNKKYSSAKLESALIDALNFMNQKTKEQDELKQISELNKILSDMNTKPNINDKIKYLKSILDEKIRPVSLLNAAQPIPLTEDVLMIINNLHDGHIEKKKKDDENIERLQLALENKQKQDAKPAKGKLTALKETRNPSLSPGSKSMQNTSDVIYAYEFNDNNNNDNNSVLFKRTKKDSSDSSSKNSEEEEAQAQNKKSPRITRSTTLISLPRMRLLSDANNNNNVNNNNSSINNNNAQSSETPRKRSS